MHEQGCKKGGARPLLLSERVANAGFTLLELILVLVIMGILSFAALQLFSRNAFDARGYADQVSSMLRFAQKEAIAKRRNVCVNISATNVTLSFAATAGTACDWTTPANNTDLVSPAGDAPFSKTAPSGVSIAVAATFSFDPLGRPSAAQTVTVTDGSTSLAITVEGETGYVHD